MYNVTSSHWVVWTLAFRFPDRLWSCRFVSLFSTSLKINSIFTWLITTTVLYLLNMIVEDNRSYLLPVCCHKSAFMGLFADVFPPFMLLCILGQVMTEWVTDWMNERSVLIWCLLHQLGPYWGQTGRSGRAEHLKLLRRFILLFSPTSSAADGHFQLHALLSIYWPHVYCCFTDSHVVNFYLSVKLSDNKLCRWQLVQYCHHKSSCPFFHFSCVSEKLHVMELANWPHRSAAGSATSDTVRVQI